MNFIEDIDSLKDFDVEEKNAAENPNANENYKEILKLDKLLNEADIPHELIRNMDGWQILYPDKQNCVSDAIEYTGSYGDSVDKLEIMGLLTADELKEDTVAGYLTAEDVFERWKKDYKKEDNK